jgi:Icc-related predicted phosphoesterase
MRLVVVSDTHGLHNRIESLPAGDILVHAGDFMNSGYDTEDILSFDRWLGEQSFKHRVVCAGNHDRYFQNSPQQARSLLTNALYLESAGVTIGNVSFWGSPYTPEFLNWAFMYPRGSAAKRYWDQIPYNLDVLITHGPPFGILDQTAPGDAHLGCEELLKAVEEKKPKLHLFGHIHGGAGTFENEVARFVNAAYLNERYKPLEPAGKVRIIDL